MRDSIGNELKVGDLVMIQVGTPMVRGRIVDITQGGIITGLRNGQQEVRPVTIAVQSIHTIHAHPQVNGINEIVCLREDNPPPAVVEELKESERPN